MALLFPKIVELLGGGASLEEVDYLRQVLRYYSPALLPVSWFSIHQDMRIPAVRASQTKLPGITPSSR